MHISAILIYLTFSFHCIFFFFFFLHFLSLNNIQHVYKVVMASSRGVFTCLQHKWLPVVWGGSSGTRPTEHQGWSLVAPSPPPGYKGLATGLSLHTHCHFLPPHPILFLPPPSSPSSSPCIAPPQAVGTLVQRFFSRKERSMFWHQADTGTLITSNPSAVLLADMKQMPPWLPVLWDVDSPMKIVGSWRALLTREVTEKVLLSLAKH